MKKVALLTAIFIGSFFFSQQQSSDNVFNNSDESSTVQNDQQYSTDGGPTGPGDPVPVNDYIPMLLIAGFVLTVFAVRKKEKTV